MKKQALKTKWERYYPLGFEHETERSIFVACLFGASVWGIIGFYNRYSFWINSLDKRNPEYRNFYEILDKAFFWFPIVLAFLLAAVIMHYAYHHTGSKSIYLMRRLPSKWELHRRCFAGPIVCAVILLAVGIVLFGIFYASYMLFTPDEWLTGNQLKKLFMFWSVM